MNRNTQMGRMILEASTGMHGDIARDIAQAWCTLAEQKQELQSRIEALEQYERAYNEWSDKTEWVQQTAKPQDLGKHRADVLRERIEALEKDAERFIKLAAHMTFSLDGEYVTMDFSCPVDATKTHDVHEDWIEPRFTDSVRRTVDTAMQSEKGGL